MSFRDDLLAVLTGGLGAIAGGGATTMPVQPVEEIPPEPQLSDREPFLGFARGVGTQQIVIGGAAVLGLLAVILIARRL